MVVVMMELVGSLTTNKYEKVAPETCAVNRSGVGWDGMGTRERKEERAPALWVGAL